MISGSVADGIHYTVKNDEKELFNNWNIGGMSNGPSSNPSFTISSPAVITYVDTYHWNYGKGKKQGTIALKHSDGTIYGPWDAYSPPGSAIDVYWTVEPNVKIKAGTYKIIDSDPKTWSYNPQSKNQGFAAVKALKSSSTSGSSALGNPGSSNPACLPCKYYGSGFEGPVLFTPYFEKINDRSYQPGKIFIVLSVIPKGEKEWTEDSGKWYAFGPYNFKSGKGYTLEYGPKGRIEMKEGALPYYVEGKASWLQVLNNDHFDESSFSYCVVSKERFEEISESYDLKTNADKLIGTYKTAWGDLVLNLKGNTVTGYYSHDNGKISGTISGKTVSGTWSEAPTYAGNRDSGKFVWKFTDDFSSFSGTWGYGGSSTGSGGWSGTKK